MKTPVGSAVRRANIIFPYTLRKIFGLFSILALIVIFTLPETQDLASPGLGYALKSWGLLITGIHNGCFAMNHENNSPDFNNMQKPGFSKILLSDKSYVPVNR